MITDFVGSLAAGPGVTQFGGFPFGASRPVVPNMIKTTRYLTGTGGSNVAGGADSFLEDCEGRKLLDTTGRFLLS